MKFDLNVSIENDASRECSPNDKDDTKEVRDSEDENNWGDEKSSGAEKTCGDHSMLTELEGTLEVGNTVESPEQVYLLYCEYGRLCGFSVRKGDQNYFYGTNLLRMKEYHCSCEGRHDEKRSKGRLATYKKQITHTSCKASIRIVRQRGSPWVVQKFIKDHNHELLAEDQSYLLRSARHLSHAKQSLIEALNAAGIGVSRACRFMESEAGGPQNLGFTRKDAYNHLNRIKLSTSVESVDANALVQFFVKKSNEEPFFYWNVQSDDEGRLMNFFWRDSRSLIDYEYFGDVLSVDTTYKTNRYNLICAPFVGINHHMKNVMFGMAFLSNETSTSFEWLFSTFLESMHGREPRVIFSDQSQPLMNGIDLVFQSASHRLCQWHISRNAPSHFGSLNSNSDFRKSWYYCMNGVESEFEFEKCWASMIGRFNLQDNSWFSNMYKLRKRWASVFTNNTFSAGLLATSRSEVTNKVLKDLCNARCSLIQIVENYEKIQVDWRRTECADDAANVGTPGQFVNNSLLLSQASKIYTRAVYKTFEAQLALALTVAVIGNPTYVDDVEMQFIVASQPLMLRFRSVQFNRLSHQGTCSCRMWETEGVLCRHIFRVYLVMNVMKFPECYILRRWMKKAKERHVDIGQLCKANTSDFVSEMAFVNYAMRMTLEIAHDVKGESDSRQIMLDRISALKKELTAKQNAGSSSVRQSFKKGSVRGQSTEVRPPPARKRGINPDQNLQSHWSRKKSKGQKRTRLPKWPDVECSQQTESTRDLSTDSKMRSHSVSIRVNTPNEEYTVEKMEWQSSKNKAKLSEYEEDANLDNPIDVTSIFQSQVGENAGPVWV